LILGSEHEILGPHRAFSTLKKGNISMGLKKADYIWFNGKILPWEKATIHVMSHALHYGSSVFEGIRVYKTPEGCAFFRLQEHIERLFDSAKIYRFHINYSCADVIQACKDIVLENKLHDGAYLRPLAFLGDIGLGLCPPQDKSAEVMVAAFPWASYLGNESLSKGVDVKVASWQRMAANTVPVAAKAGGHYLSSQLISREAKSHGYDEGIALNTQGLVSEGAGENIFIIKKGVVVTPPLTASILPGITRATVMTLAQNLGYEVKEQPLSRESLYLADEMMMTGTAAEIVPVRSVDGIQVGTGKCGEMTRKIQQAFFGLFSGETKDQWGWLTAL
jgi:branched-chain amino acid aminotransferase